MNNYNWYKDPNLKTSPITIQKNISYEDEAGDNW